MDGILYLWVLWGMWVYTTFILKKSHPDRFRYSFLCLLLICVFPYGMMAGSVEVSFSVIVLALICIVYIRNLSLREKLYMLAAVLSMGMTYAGIALISIYDPVLMFIDRDIILSLSVVLVGILFYSHSSLYRLRLIAVALSSVTGDFFLSVPLNKVGFYYSIGGAAYLDVLALTIGLLSALIIVMEINQAVHIKTQTKKGEMKNI
ncbi:YphA family membrane protein [Rossellomorea sp. LjRoot5]|uniref:YphA family membrane protein n=1 Tax=Rossellomorea sp. LjRoot5 TaxID=3342331 RepID=UPI003ECF2F88